MYKVNWFVIRLSALIEKWLIYKHLLFVATVARKDKYIRDAATAGVNLTRKRAKPLIIKSFERTLYNRIVQEGSSNYECVVSFAHQLQVF